MDHAELLAVKGHKVQGSQFGKKPELACEGGRGSIGSFMAKLVRLCFLDFKRVRLAFLPLRNAELESLQAGQELL
ncbi:hypothetical protein CA264_20285 [Pontibacter actiniarum]|uniref:Uncharacterized protein n=1 Tax=Pontibacter actiniarum TaxID=323450 RepID=A0A1X9YXB5_9BACT|nr:hypothetical protein CA264_20285 [Pontibacter actiniarum]